MIAPVRFLVGMVDSFRPAEGAPPGRLWPFMRWALEGAGWALALTFLTSILAGTMEMLAAVLTGWVIDYAVAQGPGDFLALYWPSLLVMAVFFLLLRPLVFAADSATSSILIGPHLFPLILARLNRYTLGHSMRFFDNDFAGRISQKAMQTSRALTDIILEFSDAFVYGLAIFIGTMILLSAIDIWLLLGFTVWGVFYIAALLWFIPRIQRRAASRAGARAAVTGQVVDTLSNITTVKLFGHDDYEDAATRNALQRFLDRSLEFGMLSALYRLVLLVLGGTLPLMALAGSLWLWSRGAATAGDIAMASMAATRLSMITGRMGRAAVSIFTNLGEVQDGIATLTPKHEITDQPGAAEGADLGDGIRFEHLTYGYGHPGRLALDDFDLHIAPGEKIALVGASGAGKSTVVSLLLRLYDVEKGRILLGGTDLRQITQAALRQQISVVRQETAMFNRSALDNIRYGRPEATEAEVHRAARMASAHEFILELHDFRGRTGYDAHLGERGVKLSGGQRQRIALARAILKDAPILVLDEATSALDSEVEAEIQEALEQVMQGKTVLAIAHRLSTLARMDRIVVLDAGRIVEEGRHADLLARNGLYARYWNRQSGGFLITEDDSAEPSGAAAE
ncbi:ABC transporter ATP-binding protein [Frigidibacter sp. ROC022]|uniref:ABC transporter ATP-binding protein n=1 Tax=Frigidibacter sp. ROC022 TaxID=2971796 RepID=UPI00215A3EBE|nr:ABC transporter ATP-binding protein [Frigidibacter sp. ROC022]MCR8724448.1 ABC transporter ATP-binding protein/permease [Frigidibacter sp. ROC022]